MRETINNIVIVGGGTAGWLSACNLAKKLNINAENSFNVTLIESPDIPTIGVGEGTWPTMRKTLSNLGIDEAEFMRECNATFKHGTKFVNWRKTPQNGSSEYYYNLFTSYVDPSEFNLAPYWQMGLAEDGKSYPDAVSMQEQICQQGLAPKKITTPAYDGIVNYAYSLDAGKFAAMLKRLATKILGVKHISANVNRVNLDVQGFIDSVDTDTAGVVSGDFFVDCTGSKALLIGEALGIPYIPFTDSILTNHAVFMQVPHESEDSPIVPCTVSTAHECGWTWDISLTNRRGVGYVYSDAYCSHERAEEILRNYIGPQADKLTAKKIPIIVGQRKKSFHKNCLALGMASAFVEPLEASAIFLMEAGSNMLADLFPRHRSALPRVEKTFNESFNYRWEKTLEFIKMHYYLSDRDDSDFWLDNRKTATVPESLIEKLEHWKYHPISKYDFPHTFEPFAMESFQFVLYGMNNDLNFSHTGSFGDVEKAKQLFAAISKTTEIALRELPNHRELINKIYKYGLQKV
ncbi:MAG: tryptophan 7-halogenase [Alteromonadaceae bacterium]|nr:tryptophan 7-halogenase [Alteromonadaceae bacterium]